MKRLSPKISFRIYLLLIIQLVCGVSFAQQLDKIGDKDPIKVTGGVSANQVFYGASGIDNRRDPYNYFLTGNLNFDVYGFAIPLTFTYSNQNATFQQPFNQFTLSPTYKNIQFYGGFNSMSFSRYTLAGHIFLGGGVEVKDLGKWSVSAMYGRLQKAIEVDTTAGSSNDPFYKRMGGGVKVRYADGGDYAEVIVFNSKDDANSLDTNPEEFGITPEENLVISFNASKTLFNRLIIKGEVAGSALTRDMAAESVDFDEQGRFSIFKPFFNHRLSTSYYNALNTQINYAGNFYTVGLSYERVDPGYETHGAYFFNNDLESIAINTSWNLLEGKVNLGTSLGRQRNDLDGEQSSEMSRLSTSVNLGFVPSPKATFTLSYSNFSTFTNFNTDNFLPNQLTQFDNLDTLNYRQVSQSANLTSNFILGNSKDRRHNLNINGSYQTSADTQAGNDSGSDFYSANAAYTFGITPINFNLTGSFNANANLNSSAETYIFGPSIIASKSFLERKLRSTFSTSFNKTQVNGEPTGQVYNIRIVLGYLAGKKHNINLNMVMLNRTQTSQAQDLEGGLITKQNQFTEYTATLGYAYSFSK